MPQWFLLLPESNCWEWKSRDLERD